MNRMMGCGPSRNSVAKSRSFGMVDRSLISFWIKNGRPASAYGSQLIKGTNVTSRATTATLICKRMSEFLQRSNVRYTSSDS